MPEVRAELARVREAIAAQSEQLAIQREELTLSREEIFEQRQTLERLRQARRDAFEHAPLILRRLTELERILRGNSHDLHRPLRAPRRRPLGVEPR